MKRSAGTVLTRARRLNRSAFYDAGSTMASCVHARNVGSLRDAAARAVMDRALDSFSRKAGAEPVAKVVPTVEIDKDVEYDALTWKSVVDQPIIQNADSLSSEQLYPAGSPPWTLPSDAASARSSVPSNPDAVASRGQGGRLTERPYDETADHLDMGAFPGASSTDPFAVVQGELAHVNANIKALLGVDHPVLETVARYFFNWEGGKKVRPALVMLMAHAVNTHVASQTGSSYTSTGKITLTSRELVAGQELAARGVPALTPADQRVPLPAQVVLPLQRRLAEITELIHTASLLHDDVIDAADTRRGHASVNTAFGNKLAVLAGDFLLARASVCLARLRNVPTVELLSTVIEHLVKGEVMQMRHALRSDSASRAAFDMYLRKTYYKTGSLMANSCKAIGLLGCYPDEVCEAAFRYGMHLGIAFQLIDDLLDYTASASSLGKPALNDIKQGLATAPVLYAAHRFPTLLPLIERKFASPGDVDHALQCITASDSLTLTRRLAVAHGNMALDAIKGFADSPARTALAALVSKVLNRDR